MFSLHFLKEKFLYKENEILRYEKVVLSLYQEKHFWH